jgi:hypothetical protein
VPARRAPFDHLDAVPLVCVFALQLVQGLAGAQQSDTTSGQDAFLDRGPGRMHGIVNAILALLPLDLGGAADARVCHLIAKELGTNRSAAGRFPISNLQYVQTPPFGRGAGVCYGRRGITPTWGASREAAMIGVLNDLVLFSCLAAFVSGIVIAAATLLI